MDIESLRTFCLSLPGATEQIQWGSDLVFKVGEKMFLITGFSPPHSFAIKCSEEDFNSLLEREGIKPAPYLARHKWVSVGSLSVLTSGELQRYVRRSYDAVVAKLPKRKREGLIR